MKLKYGIYGAIFWLSLIFCAQVLAEVEWDVQRTLTLKTPPRDVAVSMDGRLIFVLTHEGTVLVYSPAGGLMETFKVGRHVDQIRVGPREDLLLLVSRQKQTVDVITIDFKKEINISGSPFKGPAKAPVVIAVFSEFQ